MHIFSAFENVWKEVENLPEAERIAVDYETLEKLFFRKLIAKAQNKPKVKPPKEVSGNNQTCILFPGFSGKCNARAHAYFSLTLNMDIFIEIEPKFIQLTKGCGNVTE